MRRIKIVEETTVTFDCGKVIVFKPEEVSFIELNEQRVVFIVVKKSE